MIDGARYAHTNLIARDWRALAGFYERVLGCVPVPPERHYAAADIEAGTGLPGARLDGIHLRLPGYGPDGPTLEIFTYDPQGEQRSTRIDGIGLGHLAFQVRSVADAREEILRNGGRPVGEIVTMHTADGREVTWCYVTDPEGNVVELQSWRLSPSATPSA